MKDQASFKVWRITRKVVLVILGVLSLWGILGVYLGFQHNGQGEYCNNYYADTGIYITLNDYHCQLTWQPLIDFSIVFILWSPCVFFAGFIWLWHRWECRKA